MGKGGSGGAWRAFLVLAGVLLAAAAMPTAVGQWDCDARCVVSHSSDPWNVPMCILRCHTSGVQAAANDGSGNSASMDINFLRSVGGDPWSCDAQCAVTGITHPTTIPLCVLLCHYGVQAAADDIKVYGGGRGGRGGEGEGGKQCQERCERHEDPWKKVFCLMDCKRREQEEGGGSRDAAVVVDEGRDRCQKMCQKHSDLMEQLRCMQQCRQEEAGGSHDAVVVDEDRHGGDRCEKQCQQYGDQEKRQQCLRSCRGGGRAGWETVAGAILEVV